MIEPVKNDGQLTGFRITAAERPLTWRQVMAILAGLAAFVFGIMAFGQGFDSNRIRYIGQIGLPISVFLSFIFTIWHLRLVRRPDLQPDILAHMAPPESIFQLGLCHLHFTAAECGAGVEIIVYVQNLADGPGKLHMRFAAPRSIWKPAISIPDLRFEIPPAAVIRVDGRFLPDESGPEKHKVYLEGRFRGTGHQIRFGRRRALIKRVNPLLTIAMLLTGHIHFGRGVVLSFTTNCTDAPQSDRECDGKWTTLLVWPEEEQNRTAPAQLTAL